MEDFVKKADGLHRPFFVLPVIAASEKFIYGKAASHHLAGEDHLRQGCQPSQRRRHSVTASLTGFLPAAYSSS
jgi:hypothetical protein